MRILHLGKFAPPAVGGMETFLAALMNRQALDGHQVHAVRLTAPGGSRAAEGSSSTRIFRATDTPSGGPKRLIERFFAPFSDPIPPPSGPFADDFPWQSASASDERLRSHAPPPRCLDVPALWTAGPAPFAPGYRAAVRGMVDKVRPDVVHVHLPNLSALWSLPKASIPLVVHWHADVPIEALPLAARLAWPAYRLALDRVLARAARIVCTSNAVREASAPLRKHREKCVVVPLGIELDVAAESWRDLHPTIEPNIAHEPGGEPCPAIEPDAADAPEREPCPASEPDAACEPWREPYPADRTARNFAPSASVDTPGREPYPARVTRARDANEQIQRPVSVLGLGRFAPYKGFDVLTRAAALAPPDLRFILAGEGPLLDSVRRLAASLGVRGRLTFAGLVSDARRDRLLAECDIFCLPAASRAEAFGLVALEAMRLARPIVACRPAGSGVAEVVEHEVTGLVVPAADPAALARALARLAASPDERARMGLAGRRRLLERFDLSRVALALDEVYRQAGRLTGR